MIGLFTSTNGQFDRKNGTLASPAAQAHLSIMSLGNSPDQGKTQTAARHAARSLATV
jgi:hypothetical protein